MSEPQVLQGGCLCGKIRYTITASSLGAAPEPICNIVCHCTNCKKTSGTHMVNTSMFRRDQFTLTSGTPKTYKDHNTDSGAFTSKHFCGDCGSHIYVTSSVAESILTVHSGTLDEGATLWKPNKELYVESKSHWLPEIPIFKKEGIIERHPRGPESEQAFVELLEGN